MGHSNLSEAKKAKNDEFYTQLSDIEAELCHYPKDAFRDKVIYLPTDVAQPRGRVLKSNFIVHFKAKAFDYGYKALVATCLLENNPDDDNKYVIKRHKTSYYPGRQYNQDGKIKNTPETPYYTYEEYYGHCPSDADLGIEGGYGSGDFRSRHCTDILGESDVVVTNPPFSLFREFMAWLVRNDKRFIIIGNQNAITYKEVFPLIKDNKMWLGVPFKGLAGHFYSPYEDTAAASDHKEGMIRVSGACWFTNVDLDIRHEPMILYQKYSEELYPKYDNYDAIEVSKAKDIPCDYDGVMGVPITWLYKYCPDQFEIIRFRKGDDDKDLSVNGKCPYFRILIRRKSK